MFKSLMFDPESVMGWERSLSVEMMNASSKLSVGIIGIGHWGANVLRNLVNHPRARVACLCDPSEKALSKVAGMVPDKCKCVSSASQVIEDPDIDAVVIVTPTSTHFKLAEAALNAGKHVFCEKPLATDPDECRILCELAEKRNRRLMVGFTFLFNNSVEKVREIINDRRLGEIYYLTSVRTHLGLIREDVSSLWDLAPHDVSVMNYLLGSAPEMVSAVGSNPLQSGRTDIAFINLFYPGGIMGNIHVSWLNSSKERLLKIIGSRARVEFDDLNILEPVRLFEKGIGFAEHIEPDFGGYKHLLRDGDIISPKIEMQEPLGRMTDAFIRLVLDNKETVSDGYCACEVTQVLFAAHESVKANGAPVVIPRTLARRGAT